MPIQLPQPAGMNLPDLPQNLPTLADVVAAKSYQARVDTAVGNALLVLIEFDPFIQHRKHLVHLQQMMQPGQMFTRQIS
jgi:hypothetical protein